MSTTPTLPADFFDKKGDKPAPTTLPPDFDFGEKTPSRKGGAGGSWEPETRIEKAEREVIGPEVETFRRGAGAAAEAVKGTLEGAGRIATSPFRDVKVTPEEKAAGFQQTDNPIRRYTQEVGRQVLLPAAQAGAFWKQQLSDPQTRATLLDRVLEVAPEAIGTGAGTVLGGKFMEAAGGTAQEYNPYGVKTRGIRGIEETVAKHGAAAADEVPIRDVLRQIFDMGEHGHTVPDVVKKINTWFDGLDKAKETPAPGGGTVEAPSQGLSFADLRKIRTALDAKIDWGATGGKTTQMDALLKKLRNVADKEEIKSVYRSGGPTDTAKYVRAKQLYSRGKSIERAGRYVGGAVGAGAGIAVGSAIGKEVGHPFYGAGVGASVGGAAGTAVGTTAARALTEAGMPKSVPAAEAAMSELKAEQSASVERAQNFGKGESDVELALRRTGLPEGEQQRIRDIIRQNQEMKRPSPTATKTNPEAATPEIWKRIQRERPELFKKKGSEMKAAQDEAIAREKAAVQKAKGTSYTDTARHNEAIAQAKTEMPGETNFSKIMKRADEIERAGRQ